MEKLCTKGKIFCCYLKMQLQMVTVPLEEMSLNADNHTYEAVFSLQIAKHIWGLDTFQSSVGLLLKWSSKEVKELNVSLG